MKNAECDQILRHGPQPGYFKEMNREVLSQYEVFAVSEGAGSTFEDAHNLVDADRNELQILYHFEGVGGRNSLDGYELWQFKKFIPLGQRLCQDGWLSIFPINHDVAPAWFQIWQ